MNGIRDNYMPVFVLQQVRKHTCIIYFALFKPCFIQFRSFGFVEDVFSGSESFRLIRTTSYI